MFIYNSHFFLNLEMARKNPEAVEQVATSEDDDDSGIRYCFKMSNNVFME